MSPLNENNDPNLASSMMSPDIEEYQQHVDQRAKVRRKKELSRRALIATGWVVPIVMSVSLATPAKASGGKSQLGGGISGGVGSSSRRRRSWFGWRYLSDRPFTVRRKKEKKDRK